MSELLKLAERCEQATGPSDELQFAIGDAVGATRQLAPFQADGSGVRDCPPYTHSLDAAMTLVPEGWRLARVHHPRRDEPAEVLLVNIQNASRGHSSLLQLAIVAAALRARAAITQGEPS